MINVTRLEGVSALVEGAAPAPRPAAPGFGDALTSAISGVDASMLSSEAALRGIATGESTDIHGAMIGLTEANIALRTMASVRDKLVDGWETLWGMQI